MRKILMLSVLSILFSPAALAEFTWSGGVGIRHMRRDLNDGLDTKNGLGKDSSITRDRRWEYRAGVSLLSKTESVDFGLDLRTVNGTTSEWLTGNNNADIAITIGQAFARLRGDVLEGKGSATVGRQKTVILYDNMAQMLFDNDVRFDGFGWTWKRDFYGINLAQYILGATQLGAAPSASTYSYTEATQFGGDTGSHFAVLYQFQPFVEFKIADDIKSLFAVGYHNWSGTGAKATTGWYNNNVHGGTNTAGVGNVNALPMDNVQQWQILSDTSLPYNLRFVAEYIRNKSVYYGLRTFVHGVKADIDALALSLAWGKPKKAGEYGFAYSFSDKGLGSVINTFTNGDIAADNQSHFFEGKYMLADALSVAAKAQFHKEKSKLGGDGQPLASPNEKRHQTQKRFEFIGSLAF